MHNKQCLGLIGNTIHMINIAIDVLYNQVGMIKSQLFVQIDNYVFFTNSAGRASIKQTDC